MIIIINIIKKLFYNNDIKQKLILLCNHIFSIKLINIYFFDNKFIMN